MMFHIIVVLLFLCGSIEASASETKSFEGCTVHLVPPSHYTANSSICDGITWAKGRPDNDFLVYNMQSGRLFHYVNDSFEHGKYDVLNTSNWDLAIHNPQKEDSNVYYFKHSDKVFPMNLQVEELHLSDLQGATSVVLDGLRVNSTATKLVLLNSSLNFTITLSEIKGIDRPVVRMATNFKGANSTNERESQSIMSGSFLQVMVDTSHPGEYVYTIQTSLCDEIADPITIKVVILNITSPLDFCQSIAHVDCVTHKYPVRDTAVQIIRNSVTFADDQQILPTISVRVNNDDIPVSCDDITICVLKVKKDYINQNEKVIVTTTVDGIDGSCSTFIQLKKSGVETWVIVVAVIAVVIAVVIAAIVAAICIRRKRKENEEQRNTQQSQNTE